MNIPDPIELMENRIEQMIFEYEEEKCMSCGKKVDYELIAATPSPDSPVVCFECLSDEAQAAYIKFWPRDRTAL